VPAGFVFLLFDAYDNDDLRECSAGDEVAMTDFLSALEEHKDEFYRFLRRTLWNAAQADDVFADAVLTAYENFHRFQPGTNFRAWMYRILANKCFCANRETSRNNCSLDDLEEPAVSDNGYESLPKSIENPEDVLELCSEEVYQAFEQLNPVQRMCILLKDVEGFSYKEIAEMLDIPGASVMTHLARGRKRLRELLVGYAKEKRIGRCHQNDIPTEYTIRKEGSPVVADTGEWVTTG